MKIVIFAKKIVITPQSNVIPLPVGFPLTVKYLRFIIAMIILTKEIITENTETINAVLARFALSFILLLLKIKILQTYNSS
jgi:hypothetical protein